MKCEILLLRVRGSTLVLPDWLTWMTSPPSDEPLFDNVPYDKWPLSAKELVKNREPDDDGVYRRYQPHNWIGERLEKTTLEVFEFQPTLTMTPKAGGMTIGWKSGTLQRALRIEGPWEDLPIDDPWLDVASGKRTEERILILPKPPFLPSKFFRIKPGSE